ncbi:MAG: aspartate/glutamate racemase family protein [Micrococcaceae bacterium]
MMNAPQGIVHQPSQQMFGGHVIGILVLNTGYPLLPGNLANAGSFDFPVRYQVVEGVESPALIGGDRSVLDPILTAAAQLEADGCRAIVGACGYFARYQQEVSAAVSVPVFLSSLCQVPMIAAALRPAESLGILCANSAKFDPALLDAVGAGSMADRCVVAGLEDAPAFRGAILEDQGWMDTEAVESEVINAAIALVGQHPDIGALLLECSDMPPYAQAISRATEKPVWDYLTLTTWIHASIVKRRFEGFI